jgi:hypothetical protein
VFTISSFIKRYEFESSLYEQVAEQTYSFVYSPTWNSLPTTMWNVGDCNLSKGVEHIQSTIEGRLWIQINMHKSHLLEVLLVQEMTILLEGKKK